MQTDETNQTSATGLVVDGKSQKDTNEEDKNFALANAYAMRAYLYFIMARTWGGVPIVTEPSEGYNADVIFTPSFTLRSVKQMKYEQLQF